MLSELGVADAGSLVRDVEADQDSVASRCTAAAGRSTRPGCGDHRDWLRANAGCSLPPFSPHSPAESFASLCSLWSRRWLLWRGRHLIYYLVLASGATEPTDRPAHMSTRSRRADTGLILLAFASAGGEATAAAISSVSSLARCISLAWMKCPIRRFSVRRRQMLAPMRGYWCWIYTWAVDSCVTEDANP